MDDFDDLSNADFLDDLSADSESGKGDKAGGAVDLRDEFGLKGDGGTWDETAYKDSEKKRDDYDYGDRTIASRLRDLLIKLDRPDVALRFLLDDERGEDELEEGEDEVGWGEVFTTLLKVLWEQFVVLMKLLWRLLKYIGRLPKHPFFQQFNRKQKFVLGMLTVGVVLVGAFGYAVVSRGGFGGFGDGDSKSSVAQTGTAIFLEAKMLEEKLTATRAAAARVEKNVASTATVSFRQTEYASLTTPTVAFTLAPNATYGFGVTPPTAEVAETPVPSATVLASGECSCTGDLYQCADFSTHDEAQACYEYCIEQGLGDIHNIDIDQNEFACESLP